ncbi:hypothetical protein [Roseateles sp.]|uniref:hypothetical protein n=1 Tax=Roseateles sp. TaxID=1971397 RepID=UPI0031D37A16
MTSIDRRRLEDVLPELTGLVTRLVQAMEQRSAVLTHPELAALTGYKRAADQLRELHERGFSRAYVRAGVVVLERPHFEVVRRGAIEKPRFRVIPPVVKPRKPPRA